MILVCVSKPYTFKLSGPYPKQLRISNCMCNFLKASLLCGSFHVKCTKISKVGTWPISDSDETFPDVRYIWDKIILKISEQTNNPFKSYHTSKLAKLKNRQNKADQAAWVHFWVSITFFFTNTKFWNLRHLFLWSEDSKIS